MGPVFSYNLVVYRYSLKLYQNAFLDIKVIDDKVFMHLMLTLMFHVKQFIKYNLIICYEYISILILVHYISYIIVIYNVTDQKLITLYLSLMVLFYK